MEIKEIQQLVQAYFDGLFPPEGRSLLKRWLILPTDAERKDSALKAVWNNAEPDATDVEAALETFRNNRRSYERQRQRRHRTALLLRRAAVLALPLLAAAAAWKLSADYHAQPRLAEFHVGEGRIDSLTLADGSKIIVNAASTLLYPATFNPHTGRRDVFLTGEAHFEVAKDERHPFIVHAGNLDIRVLGTHFNVRAYADDGDIVTTLEEGSVRLSDNSRAALMKPGEQIAYRRADGFMRRKQVKADDFRLWTRGRVDFHDQPLQLILEQIGTLYHVTFDIDDSIDLRQRFTMDFNRNENIDEVMAVISRLDNSFRYHRRGKTIRLHAKRKTAAP